jgi:hypothetical protein
VNSADAATVWPGVRVWAIPVATGGAAATVVSVNSCQPLPRPASKAWTYRSFVPALEPPTKSTVDNALANTVITVSGACATPATVK